MIFSSAGRAILTNNYSCIIGLKNDYICWWLWEPVLLLKDWEHVMGGGRQDNLIQIDYNSRYEYGFLTCKICIHMYYIHFYVYVQICMCIYLYMCVCLHIFLALFVEKDKTQKHPSRIAHMWYSYLVSKYHFSLKGI